ncbi:alpha/beta fold hydrolase [Falsiroseomonas bella]|nr:alpha/beta hydrolase [Falsiroseomonas bella]
MTDAAFGWRLRDPAPGEFFRLGKGGLWMPHAVQRAAAPPLLFVPGGYHGAWCYAGYLDDCAAAGIAAAAAEPRGHGVLAADGLHPGSGLADYAADVAEASRHLASLAGTAPVLVGHSLGALVVAMAAHLAPGSGLVLLAPSPPGNLPDAQPVPPVPEDRLRPPPSRAEALARFFGGVRPRGLDAWCARLCPESPRALNDRYLLRVGVDPAPLRRLPSLCIEAGREDPARHPAGQDEAVAAFYGARHLLLPEAPHCLMVGPAGAESAAIIRAWHAALPRS